VVGDPCGVAHHQGPHLALDDEGDDLFGGLMLGLVDAAAMPRLGTPNACPVATPAP
jgi:hypothetical protein